LTIFVFGQRNKRMNSSILPGFQLLSTLLPACSAWEAWDDMPVKLVEGRIECF